ncbi:hypothetical protein [Legionella bozemanae]|nr:hypothetical protein [Legionella bozemanae]
MNSTISLVSFIFYNKGENMKGKYNAEDFISDFDEYGFHPTHEDQQGQDEPSIVEEEQTSIVVEEEQSYRKSEAEDFISDFDEYGFHPTYDAQKSEDEYSIAEEVEVTEVVEENQEFDFQDQSDEEYGSVQYSTENDNFGEMGYQFSESDCRRAEDDIEPVPTDILKEQYSLLGAVSQFLFGNEKSKEEYNCPRREKLAHRTEGCSTPVSAVNKSLDEQGIPLTKQELNAFSAQLESQKKFEGSTKDKIKDLVHEKQIIETLKKTADKKRKEGDLLKENGLMDKDKAEMLRKDISVAEAGSLMHSIFRFLKSPMNGASVSEDTLGSGALLSQMYDDIEREMNGEEVEEKERDYIPK